ncbi:MAG: exodeoxyribonuclease VII large subunit [Planctomycetes bacterium]|nr:exodeoxyribonuclease VII large subunit [Planctomycetota bacterium]
MKPATAADAPAALTPSDVARRMKALAEGEIGRVWVEGELSNYRKILRSGHAYFVLKDSTSQLKVALFASAGARVKFEMKDGQKVLAFGRITVYEPQGEYQMVAEQVEPKGVGAAQLALRQLKEKLEKEGLFDPARKRELPFLPRRVVLVTSPTSAAVKDMLQVIERRFPTMPVWIYPVPVQGAEAAPAMVRALAELAARDDVDVVIVGRGGGSQEDLWAFNDEALARAIAAFPVPVISAVGHEIDVTLADLVADRRAQTPSEAAELAVPELAELQGRLDDLGARLRKALVEDIRALRQRLEDLARSRGLARPTDLVERFRQRLDGLSPRLDGGLRGLAERMRARIDALRPRLGAGLTARVGRARREADALAPRLGPALRGIVERRRDRLAGAAGKLDALSPLRVLARGYSMTQSVKTEEVLRAAGQVAPGDLIRTTLERAVLTSKVTEVRPASRGKS